MISNLQGREKFVTWAIAGLLLVASVGCTATVEPTTPIAIPTVVVSISPVASPTSVTPPPAGAPAAVTDVKVTLTNGVVSLERSSVPAGPLRFMVMNDGTIVHGFAIVGNGIDQRTPDLQPGESAVLEVTLPAGEYEAYCPVPGHRERGMTTTLTVR